MPLKSFSEDETRVIAEMGGIRTAKIHFDVFNFGFSISGFATFNFRRIYRFVQFFNN
jgi:hypothetical protein